MEKTIALYDFLLVTVALRAAERDNLYNQLGEASVEERGATFGKVVGIEEAIAAHAARVERVRFLTSIVYGSKVIDDRLLNEQTREATVGSIITVSSIYGVENFAIETDDKNARRVSSSAPMGRILLGRKIGDRVNLGNDEYRIEDIRQRDKDAIATKLEALVQEIGSDAEKLRAQIADSRNKNGGKGEKGLKLEVSRLIDLANLVKLIQELYDLTLTEEEATTLGHAEAILNDLPHFPVTETRGYDAIRRALESLNTALPDPGT